MMMRKRYQCSIGEMRRGVVPFWTKKEKIGFSSINARAEQVNIKPAFREVSGSGAVWGAGRQVLRDALLVSAYSRRMCGRPSGMAAFRRVPERWEF
jgi:hypothetical protein